MRMEAIRLNICEDQELLVTDPKLQFKTCWLEKDVKEFRALLEKQVFWYDRKMPNGEVIEGKHPERTKRVTFAPSAMRSLNA